MYSVDNQFKIEDFIISFTVITLDVFVSFLIFEFVVFDLGSLRKLYMWYL